MINEDPDMEGRNVTVITDTDGRKIVMINDILFN